MWDTWVLDATSSVPEEKLYCFCPVEGDIEGECRIVYGMSMIGSHPPGILVGIVHQQGQDKVEEFCEKYKSEVDELFGNE